MTEFYKHVRPRGGRFFLPLRVGADRPSLSLIVLPLGLSFFLAISSPLAAPGDLDRTFGTEGTITPVLSPGNSVAYALVTQDDGKILAGGATCPDLFCYREEWIAEVARYNADGSADHTFGTNGKLTLHFATPGAGVTALALTPDGHIVAAGWVRTEWDEYLTGDFEDFFIVQLAADGTLDQSFGTAGIAIDEFVPDTVSYDSVDQVVLQHNGDIIVSSEDYGLVRYSALGARDEMFGTAGLVAIAHSSLAVQDDDGLVLAVGGVPADGLTVTRLSQDGALDDSFAAFGTQTIPALGCNIRWVNVVLQPTGHIVVGAIVSTHCGRASVAHYLLIRLTPGGKLDHPFGTAGSVSFAVSPSELGVQSDGSLVAVGTAPCTGGTCVGQLHVVRFTSDGVLDDTFGIEGEVFTRFGVHDAPLALAIDWDDRIVLSTFADYPHYLNRHGHLVRYEGRAPDCASQPEICDNGVDDNCDEWIDCNDPLCSSEAYCAVVIDYVELNQAVQRVTADGLNTVPLVADKDLGIRVYARPRDPEVESIDGVKAIVTLQRENEKIVSKTKAITIVQNHKPEDSASSFNTVFARSKQPGVGTYQLSVKLKLAGAIVARTARPVAFQERRRLRVLHVKVDVGGVLPAGDFADVFTLFSGVLPAPFTADQWIADETVVTISKEHVGCGLSGNSVLKALQRGLRRYNKERDVSERADFIVGFVAGSKMDGDGCSRKKRRAAFVTDGFTDSGIFENGVRASVAHEVGHLLGLPLPERKVCDACSIELVCAEEYERCHTPGRPIDEGWVPPTPERKHYFSKIGLWHGKVAKNHERYVNMMGASPDNSTWVDEETYRYLYDQLSP